MSQPNGTEKSLLADIGLALGLVALLAIVAGAFIYFISPELRSWALALMAVGLAALILFLVLARRETIRFLGTRQGRYGLNSFVMVVAFVVILALVNFLSSSANARVDLTAARQFTLTTQTSQVLAGLENLEELDGSVTAYAFFTPDDPAAEATDNLLREYSLKTSRFDYQIVDPETDPAKANRFSVDQYGTVVFAAMMSEEERTARTTTLTEQALTSTLLRATGRNLKTVCFLTGHGERGILAAGDRGLSNAIQSLDQNFFLVKDFDLGTETAVPDECAAVVVAGPDRDLGEEELNALFTYLALGGNGLFLLGPDTPDAWKTLLLPFGIEVGGGAIIDQASFARPDRTTPAIQPDQYFPEHPVTQPLMEQSLTSFFPLATRVAPIPQDQRPPNLLVVPLAFTTSASWLETDTADLGNARLNEGIDRRGPLSLAVGSELLLPEDEDARLVVVGNVAFADNIYFNHPGNGDLFLTSINWLTDREGLLPIRSRAIGPRLLIINQREWTWILYSSVGVFPFLVGLMGVWAWWRRR